MKKSSKRLSKFLRASNRTKYQDAEARFDWLSPLLDTYHAINGGISIELKAEELNRKEDVACHEGCNNCCLRPTAPISQPELWGILWYAKEELAGNIRETVDKQVMKYSQTGQCPFLVNAGCSIYPVRPIACRLIFVFGIPCKPDDDIHIARRKDLWHPSREIVGQALMFILPLFGITGKREKIKAFEEGYLVSASKPMNNIPWENLHNYMNNS
ncbi:YkgJ family cysteine cluster protein [Chloroflexota bacterium]